MYTIAPRRPRARRPRQRTWHAPLSFPRSRHPAAPPAALFSCPPLTCLARVSRHGHHGPLCGTGHHGHPMRPVDLWVRCRPTTSDDARGGCEAGLGRGAAGAQDLCCVSLPPLCSARRRGTRPPSARHARAGGRDARSTSANATAGRALPCARGRRACSCCCARSLSAWGCSRVWTACAVARVQLLLIDERRPVQERDHPRRRPHGQRHHPSHRGRRLQCDHGASHARAAARDGAGAPCMPPAPGGSPLSAPFSHAHAAPAPAHRWT